MKTNTNIKKIAILLLFMGILVLLEPSLIDRLIYAVTFFKDPGLNYDQINNLGLSETVSSMPMHQIPQQAGSAPEPSTLILFLGGVAGFAVRFVRKSFERFKRYMDLALASFGLLITLPMLTIAAVMIKLTSKGPAIYKQSRIGKNGKVFWIYKLRTMRFDAEKGTGAVWAKRNDPRVTAIGKVLRKTRIDEIPQLFNVIKGEMSIVGPRPERPEMVMSFKTLILDYEKRLKVKPGITGMAQVWHKYDETIDDVKKKIKYDLLYIRKMCLLTDLRIMAQTFVVVLTGRGAN